MLTIEQAVQRVLESCEELPARRVPLSEAVGLVLAEPVASDVDVPPFAKSLMDGYAVRSADLRAGVRRFRVVGEVLAGQQWGRALSSGETVRIMTGAPVPAGADAVVIVEDTVTEARGSGQWIRLVADPREPQANVMARGATIRHGDIVLRRGTLLGPAQIGLLAEVGCVEPLVWARPRVAVLATGDELVEAGCRPGPGQIRNSNGPMLAAAAGRAGADVVGTRLVPDDEAALSQALTEALAGADCVLLSGGVSMGKRDLVPAALEAVGVEKVFHRVRMRPGKPLWFGVHRRDGQTRLVFGLPGNPVSAFVGFCVFVRPALKRLAHQPVRALPLVPAALSTSWQATARRPTFWPARAWYREDGLVAEPLPWLGSPDLRTLASADALVFVPEGEHEFCEGQRVSVLLVG